MPIICPDRYTSHEVTAARAGRPSGRTYLVAVPARIHQSYRRSDGITMDMMPITREQLTQCRQQASSRLTDELKTLHDREHGQDKDKTATK